MIPVDEVVTGHPGRHMERRIINQIIVESGRCGSEIVANIIKNPGLMNFEPFIKPHMDRLIPAAIENGSTWGQVIQQAAIWLALDILEAEERRVVKAEVWGL